MSLTDDIPLVLAKLKFDTMMALEEIIIKICRILSLRTTYVQTFKGNPSSSLACGGLTDKETDIYIPVVMPLAELK